MAEEIFGRAKGSLNNQPKGCFFCSRNRAFSFSISIISLSAMAGAGYPKRGVRERNVANRRGADERTRLLRRLSGRRFDRIRFRSLDALVTRVTRVAAQ